MGKLIGNERRKLYKKVSTWVLLGIVVALNLFVMVIGKIMADQHTSVYQTVSWQDQYVRELRNAELNLRENPSESYYMNQVVMFQYLLDQEIPPTDWRTDVVSEYASLLSLQAGGEENIHYYYDGQQDTSLKVIPDTPEALQARIDQLKALIDGNDWKAYLRQQITYIDQNAVDVAEQEKALEMEMLNLYLDMEIRPVSQSLSYFGGETDPDAWKAAQVSAIRSGKLALLRGEMEGPYYGGDPIPMNRSQRAAKQMEVDAALERLRTGSKPVEETGFIGLMSQSTMGLSLLPLVLMVTAGGIIASEFTSGTVKLLLITPHRRSKIFWAKAAVLLELTLIGAGALFVTAFLAGGILTGFSDIGSWQVLPVFGHILRLPYLLYILLKYLLLLLPVLTYGALALMLSAVTRRGAAAISVSLVLMYGGSMAMAILSQLAMAFGTIPGIKFLLFANTELEGYLPSLTGAISAQTVDGSMTLGFSLAVLAVYFLCFMWVARDSFCRRDVK
ncbi:MAG: ABC transporter permease subunit [Clostridiales bacterium]|nr:ABC transporter permease subunit [Clostridiales bacterium]